MMKYDDSCWLVDSGATNHISNKLDGMYDVCETDDKVVLGDNNVIQVSKIGTLEVISNTGIKIKMLKVAFVPSFHRNIVAVTKLMNGNDQLITSGGTMEPRRDNMRLTFEKESNSSLFLLRGKRVIHHQVHDVETQGAKRMTPGTSMSRMICLVMLAKMHFAT